MAGVGGACHSRRICDRRWVLRRGYDKLGLAALALLFPPPSTHTHTHTHLHYLLQLQKHFFGLDSRRLTSVFTQ